MLLNQQAVRGLKLIRIYSLLQLLPSLAFLGLLILGLFWKTHITPAYAQMLAWALTGITGAIIMDRVFRHRMSLDDTIHPMPVRSILGVSSPMLMTASMQIIVSQAGIIILGMYRPAVEIGYYAVAVKLATLTTFVLSAINTMSAPKFAELYHQGRIDELLRIARKSTRLIFWTTIPILIGLLVFGITILQIFRHEFISAYPAMCILIAGQFINSISGSTGYFMSMTGHHIALQNFKAIATVISIVMAIILIPRIGINGAAVAASAGAAFWNLAGLLFIKRQFGVGIGYDPRIEFSRRSNKKVRV